MAAYPGCGNRGAADAVNRASAGMLPSAGFGRRRRRDYSYGEFDSKTKVIRDGVSG